MINLTPEAKIHFEEMLKNNKDAQGIYIGIKNAGCSGMSYVLELVAKQDESIKICDEYNINGVKVLINKEHLPHLNNLTIKYIKDNFGGHIKFINPNSTGECGCGESFTTS